MQNIERQKRLRRAYNRKRVCQLATYKTLFTISDRGGILFSSEVVRGRKKGLLIHCKFIDLSLLMRIVWKSEINDYFKKPTLSISSFVSSLGTSESLMIYVYSVRVIVVCIGTLFHWRNLTVKRVLRTPSSESYSHKAGCVQGYPTFIAINSSYSTVWFCEQKAVVSNRIQ